MKIFSTLATEYNLNYINLTQSRRSRKDIHKQSNDNGNKKN